LKQQHPDALLLFRVGDFYETFGEDAIEASRILGIVLTKRSNGAASSIELAGFPHHSLDTYLPKLVRSGRKVAVCEQLEDPKLTKKLVRRGLTDLVSPGVNQLDPLLESGKNNFLAACTLEKGKQGIALLDVSTGDFFFAEGEDAQVRRLFDAYAPAEFVLPHRGRAEFAERFGSSAPTNELPDWASKHEQARQLVLDHFKVHSLKSFAPEGADLGLAAAGMALAYVRATGRTELGHIDRLERIPEGNRMWIDGFTLRNLEIFAPNQPDGRSLTDSIDLCCSPMGKRLLRRRLAIPLCDREEIEVRLGEVEGLLEGEKRAALRHLLKGFPDLERSLGRLATGRIQARELIGLSTRLQAVAEFLSTADWRSEKALWVDISESLHRVFERIAPEPGLLGKGGVIRSGYSHELDELRSLSRDGMAQIERIREREAQETGITSLKISYNSVFGYYLEVRNTHRDRVPASWIRKQTLVNAERYITPELKEFEERISGAEERMLRLESELYAQLIELLRSEIGSWGQNVRWIARWDLASSSAELAVSRQWCRPRFSEGSELELSRARHPVIEAALPPGERFVPNDIRLDTESRQLLLVTGPNMSGKSALLRQVALLSILAQIGSYVPASSALLPLFDRLFVRVGASDNLSKGESTFMVEMIETSSILNNLRGKCLVILDEIGRGTSTYDGVSIAWSIAEFLHDHPSRPLTLFATHYHELSEMEVDFARVRNVCLKVREEGERVVFLRELIEGSSEHSFGIQVARMAGLPSLVVRRSFELLKQFEGLHRKQVLESPSQLSFFQLADPLLDELRLSLQSVDPEQMTPIEALVLLQQLKRRLESNRA
jgi:DNA mismatch repair protein MutS